MDKGTQLTTQIIDLVMKTIPDENGRIDLEATMRGIACAYVAFAYGLRAENEAKYLLVDLADALDDPAKLNWALTNCPTELFKPQ